MSAPLLTRLSTERRASAGLALLAVVVVFIWTAARIHYVFGDNWTALFYNSTMFALPSELEEGTYKFEASGYDGQFYRFLAHDPFLLKGYDRYADAPQLRFRRLLVPLSAWMLGLGQRYWIDPAYFAVEMLCLGLGVYWCARLLARRGRSAWWGLLFVVVPATLASFDRMLVDGPLTALFAGFLLYCEEERWTRVWLIAMLAALTRETGLILCAALAVDSLSKHDWRRGAWFALSSTPAAGWYLYLAAKLAPDRPVDVYATPIWSIFQRLMVLRTYPDPNVQLLLRVTDILAVLGLALSVVLAVWWIVRRGAGPVTISVGLFAALALVLGAPNHLIEAFGFGRPVSPLLLWVMIEAVSQDKWLGLMPPLAVSLSVSLTFASPLVTVVKGLLGLPKV